MKKWSELTAEERAAAIEALRLGLQVIALSPSEYDHAQAACDELENPADEWTEGEGPPTTDATGKPVVW